LWICGANDAPARLPLIGVRAKERDLAANDRRTKRRRFGAVKASPIFEE